MSDLDVAASNAADEPNAIVETVEVPVTETPEVLPPAKSNSEALDRAFEQVANEEPKTAQNRQPDGKFAKGKTEVKPTEPTDPVAAAAPQTQEAQPVAAPVAQAPNFGFSKEAQAEWGKVPEAVRKDVERRFGELTQGIEQHREAAKSYETVKYFDDWAKSGGTTLKDALTVYTNMETMLRKEPARGLIEICRNMGIDPADAGQMLYQAATSGAIPPQQQPQFDPNRLLEDVDGRLEAKLRERDAIKQIDDFKKEHPRFDELSDTIGALLEKKIAKDLPEAYAKAELLNPASAPAVNTQAVTQTPAAAVTPPAVQPAQPDPITKAKATLSISGSPEGGSNPATRKIPGSTGDALDAAFARVGL